MPTALLLASLLAADPLAAEAELSEAITEAELRAHAHRLCGPEFLGRKGPGAARAAEHLAETFKRIGLKPAFGHSFFQPVPWLVRDGGRPKDAVVGRNVAGVVVGSDPARRDEWVLVCAHHDHLGVKGGKVYPGADDNASGLAMVVEVAERFALQKHRPARSLMFVSFDEEETGLQGSTHFAAHPPVPFGSIKAVVVADLVGRSMGNVMDEYVFVLGSETAPQLRRLVEETPPPAGLVAGRLGADVIGTRSDYGPFRDRRTPFLFLSTGPHADYHKPTDTPDRLDYPKLRRVSDYAYALAGRLADAADAPAWAKEPPPPDLDEARSVHALLDRLVGRPGAHPIKPAQLETIRDARDRLAGVIARGAVTAAERAWILWTARAIMASVF